MNPPGKTTLFRMQLAAHNEARRIEISQDGGVRLGWLKQPLPDQVSLRDDFEGIVRLLDIIQSDQVILDRLEQRKNARPIAAINAVVNGDTEIAVGGAGDIDAPSVDLSAEALAKAEDA